MGRIGVDRRAPTSATLPPTTAHERPDHQPVATIIDGPVFASIR